VIRIWRAGLATTIGAPRDQPARGFPRRLGADPAPSLSATGAGLAQVRPHAVASMERTDGTHQWNAPAARAVGFVSPPRLRCDAR
jgi:hypothetical protein